MNPIDSNRKNVALVLAGGGARGLAHIGVIDELISQGYKITSIAGSSMGALVGGLYAAGTLDKFRDWAITLDKVDVARMIDFTLSTKGFIKGEKVFDKMRKLDMIPNVNIEDLSIPYTAVASDIINNQEIVFRTGDLARAIRSSIAIPDVFTAVENGNGLLVDGGVLNPLPINRISKNDGDLLVAVDLNSVIPYQKPTIPQKKKKEIIYSERVAALIKRWDNFFGNDKLNQKGKGMPKGDTRHKKMGYFEIFSRTVQLMQSKLTEYAIGQYPPDILINISKNSCSVFEFYKAEEMILYGHEACRKALKEAGL